MATKDFAEVIRHQLVEDPELARLVEEAHRESVEERKRFDAMTPEEQQRYMDEN